MSDHFYINFPTFAVGPYPHYETARKHAGNGVVTQIIPDSKPRIDPEVFRRDGAPMPAAIEPADDWDTLCERGRLAREDMDNGRWQIGDDACLVRTQYGHDKLADYAREINMDKARVKEYRQVAKFYEKAARATFLESHPTLTYSHLRATMRLKDYGQALKMLDAAADGCWTVEQTRIKVVERLGKPTPPEPLVKDVFTRVAGRSGEFGVIFEFPDRETYQRIMKAWLAGEAKALLMTLKKDE